MRIRTNTENRKEVVKAVAEILNTSSKYLGVPSCNFRLEAALLTGQELWRQKMRKRQRWYSKVW